MARTSFDPASVLTLADWGWDETWRAAFEPFAAVGLVPARVVAQHRGQWIVAAEGTERATGLTGRFRRACDEGADMPAVGDWVACEPPSRGTRIDSVLPRRSAFRRRASGSAMASQVVAANIDTLLIATSLNHDLNPRRLERYVTMARESGAEAAVVLTKADLAGDPVSVAAKLADQLGVAVTAVSTVERSGLDALQRWLRSGRTIALVGSSGVGKSTLLNVLAGRALQVTLEVRPDDDRGRHATTHRELFRIPGGALLLDTPGMRELGVWAAEGGLDATFAEIVDLAAECRFSDCRHDREPGCMVRAALDAGEIDARRLRNYQRLAGEAAETSEAARRAESRRFARMVRDVSADSMARKTYGGGKR